MKNNFKWALMAFALVAVSCDKDDDGSDDDGNDAVVENGFYILNEGGFGNGNASLDEYDSEESMLFSSVFKAANGYNLGDVAQSINEINNQIFLVINNSNKVEVLNHANLEVNYTIEDVNLPRYIVEIPGDRGVITKADGDWGASLANSLPVINLSTGQIESSIDVMGDCEEGTLVGSSLWICNTEENKILKVNYNSMSIEGEIELTFPPKSIEVDDNNVVWVQGIGYDANWNAEKTLVKIEAPYSVDDVTTVRTVSGDGFAKMAYGDGYLYTVDAGDLTKMDVNTMQTEVKGLDVTYPYSIYYHDDEDQVLIGDALDFTNNGVVYVYTDDLSSVTSFNAGIAPTGFLSK